MDPPPRQTSKIPLPEDTIIRKSVFGRAVTGFSDENDPRYSELKCGSAITQIVNDSHVFHSHELNGRKEWNRPTKIACYHCCHQFKTAPIPIPKKYDSYSRQFIVHGNFCSLSCAKTYVLDREASSPHALTLFLKMASEVYGIKECIPTAPPKEALVLFGGNMSIETFRHNKVNVAVMQPPFINSYTVIEERTLMEQTSSYHMPIGSVKGLKRPRDKLQLIVEPTPEKSPYQIYLEQRNKPDDAE
ncbi:hypothetical protein EOVG_00170 [Emiliania huxleyi virus 88]|nr:hypothetical protein EOVG_00170 [Emiliania huxleyi virus 88]